MWSRFAQARGSNSAMPITAARKQAPPETNRAGLRRKGKTKPPLVYTHASLRRTQAHKPNITDASPSDGAAESPNQQLAYESRASTTRPSLSMEDAGDGVVATATTTTTTTTTATKRLEEPPSFLAKEQESVNILKRARGRPPGKKLKVSRVVENVESVKRRKTGSALFEMSSDEDDTEEQMEKPLSSAQRPATPPRTRSRAQSTASPQNVRQTRHMSNALQSPRVQSKPATWTKANDTRLLELLDDGLPLNDIQDRMDQFTHDQIRNRASHLYYKRKQEQAKEREAEEARAAAEAKKIADEIARVRGLKAAKPAQLKANTRVPQAAASFEGKVPTAAIKPRGRPRKTQLIDPKATSSKSKPKPELQKAHLWSRQEEDHLIHVWEGTGDNEWGMVQNEFPGRGLKELERKYYQLEEKIRQRRRSRPAPDARWSSRTAAQSTPDSEPELTSGRKRRAIQEPQGPRSPAKRLKTRATAPPKERRTPEAQKATSRPATGPSSTRTRQAGALKSPELGHDDSAEEDEEDEEQRDNGLLPGLNEVLHQAQISQAKGADSESEDGDDGEDGVVHDSIEDEEAQDAEGDDNSDDGQDTLSGMAAESIDSAELLPVSLRLFGQTALLNEVFSNAVKLQRGDTTLSTKYDFRDDFKKRGRTEGNNVKVIKILTEKLEVLFDKLARTSLLEDCQQAIDQRLQKLADQVSRLDIGAGRDDLSKKSLARQVNLFTVADLLSLLKASLQSYATRQPRDAEFKLWYLECWVTITNLLWRLYNKSRKWKNVEFYGVGFIRGKLLVPLQRVVKSFTSERRALRQAVERSAQEEAKATATQQGQFFEDTEQRLVREWIDKYSRLRGLFVYRQEVSKSRNPKSTRFRMFFKSEEEWRRDVHPEHVKELEEEEPELDADGEPIERVDVFDHRRHSRPPVQRPDLGYDEESDPWSDDEKMALLGAIQRLHGQGHFWRRLFYGNCLPGQVLAERTVPEVLRMAMSFVDTYRISRDEVRDELEEGDLRGDCPGFLREVPDLDLVELLW